MSKAFIWGGLALVAGLATWLLAAGMRLLAHRLLLRGLHPERLPHEQQPTDLGIPIRCVQSVRLAGPGGATLFAWFIAPTHPPHGRAPAVLIMHGWGSNASHMLPAVPFLRDAGLAVLVMDARCHGLSDSADFTSLPRFAEDIDAGLHWLVGRGDVDPNRLALLGHSVGAGAALLCASRRRDVRAVVSLSAFAHPEEVMRRWLRAHHIPSLWLGDWVLGHVQRVIGAQFDDIAPIKTAAKTMCPVLVVHGAQDETVPVQDAHRILLASGQAADACLLVTGGHDLSKALGEGQLHGVLQFLNDSFFPASLAES